MKEIFVQLRNYFREGNKKVGLFTTLVVAILVIVNYTIGIEPAIKSLQSPAIRFLSFFLLYSFIFSVAYGIQFVFSDQNLQYKKQFFCFLLICPLYLLLKFQLTSRIS